MVKYKSNSLDATFAALADPTRRAILSKLAQGELSVGELAQPFHMSWPAITKHLKVLESAGLLARKIEGRIHRLQIHATPMAEASEWLHRYQAFWEGRLDSLANYFKDLQSKENDHDRNRPRTLPKGPRPPRKGLRRVDGSGAAKKVVRPK